MSQVVSTTTDRRYGIERVCRVWQVPRSSVYSAQARQAAEPVERVAAKRGPRTPLTDDDLVARIRADLAASPFRGEGYRKVWARLKIGQGLAIAGKRVLRLMRLNRLLSPHRQQRPAEAHDGHIITAAPDLLWGTDGAMVKTAAEGWVWVFIAVDHWNAECIGWHVSKDGSRFSATQPISQAVAARFGGIGPDVARGLSLRLDHGTPYLSEHFRRQMAFWGMTLSWAFVEQPQTNGVAERFIRTLKEQAIHGRIFHTVEEVRAAVSAFIALYNTEWRVEKLRFQTPLEARRAWNQTANRPAVA